MGDFVGEYRRDFIVGLKGLQKAASHEDVTRRHRESVDLVGVDYLEPIPIALERNPAGDSPPDVKRLALSISDVPLEVSFGGRHLKYLVEPTFETLRRRSLAVEVYAPTAETRALQFQFDVVIFWICVRDSNSLAFTKREQAVPPMESENAIVFHI